MILHKAGKTGEIQLKLSSLVCFLKLLLFQEAFWTTSFLPLALFTTAPLFNHNE